MRWPAYLYSHAWAHLSQQDCSGTKMRHLCLQDWSLSCPVLEYRQITAYDCTRSLYGRALRSGKWGRDICWASLELDSVLTYIQRCNSPQSSGITPLPSGRMFSLMSDLLWCGKIRWIDENNTCPEHFYQRISKHFTVVRPISLLHFTGGEMEVGRGWGTGLCIWQCVGQARGQTQRVSHPLPPPHSSH